MSIAEQQQTADVSYHADHGRLSNSMLANFIESRRLYEGRYVTGKIPPIESTRFMDLGNSIHAVLLDGRPLRSVVGIYPDHNPLISELRKISGPMFLAAGRSKRLAWAETMGVSVSWLESLIPKKTVSAEAKTRIKQHLPLNPIGSTGVLGGDAAIFREQKASEGYEYCVKRPEFNQMQAAINQLRFSEVWRWIDHEKTIREQPIYWTNDLGMDCRCKPDFLIPLADKTLIFDLKVTGFHTPKKWQKQVENNARNKTQCVHYAEGAVEKYGKPVEWRWVTLNPEAPLTPASVCVHRISDDSFRKCSEFYRQQVLNLNICREVGDYSEHYEADEVEVDLRDWAFV